MPTLILIAGPNGVGKTTFATEILTTDLKGTRFINADEIARGLSPVDPAAGLGKLVIACYFRHRLFSARPMIAPQYQPLRPLKLHELSEHGQVALRAHRRAARKLRAEHRRLGLPIIVWENGRVVEKQP